MKIFLFCFFMLVQYAAAQENLTTVILLRHAEKENNGSKNPGLSEAGMKRALSLAEMFAKTKLDAIYSTHYKRTESTVQPLASKHSLPVTHYDGGRPSEVNEIVAKWKGGTILICGHSNTTPAFVNQLTDSEAYTPFDDSDYGNLVIVTIGTGSQTKVTWLRY